MPINPLVKFIRGAEANKPNPVDGQILFTTDTHKLYIDDATTHHLINPNIIEKYENEDLPEIGNSQIIYHYVNSTSGVDNYQYWDAENQNYIVINDLAGYVKKEIRIGSLLAEGLINKDITNDTSSISSSSDPTLRQDNSAILLRSVYADGRLGTNLSTSKIVLASKNDGERPFIGISYIPSSVRSTQSTEKIEFNGTSAILAHGDSSINLNDTGIIINNVVTPTADAMAANKKYVDDQIADATSGLTGAMHFAGTSTTAITDGGTENPTISGYTTKTAGDIVLYNGKEFVWTGTAWEELGDEGSYALKTVTVTGANGLTGGGALSSNQVISHATPTGASAGAKGNATANNNTFLKTVTTDAYGHITASSTEALALATSSMIGGIKIGYSESGKNYAVKLSDGKAYVTVPWENSEYTLTAATASALGGIKVGYTTSGKNYKVQLDSNNNAYVNVPWTDNNDNTTYTFASGTTKGAFQVTPSGGAAQTVSIYGWGTAAELASATSVQNNNTTLPTGAAVQSYVSTAVSDAALTWNEF